MKKLSLLLLLCTLIFATSCNDDETNPGETVLRYDNGEDTGPLLPAGINEAAVLFPASTMAEHVGKRLTQIEFLIGQQPAGASVIVSGPGTDSQPGPIIYDADVTNAIQIGEFSRHFLASPVTIDGTDLWISVGVFHDAVQQSIGCDSGPNVINGDWLYQETDNTWQTFTDRTNESINWNIRGILEE